MVAEHQATIERAEVETQSLEDIFFAAIASKKEP
jgi:hypothetical protein